jgi:type I restriction enzyme S subunit
MSRAENKIAENLITDNIDIWTGAIKKRGSQGRGSNKKIELYGIKKLRELILDLAVRGLLVPQDSNDEPVSVLLEKIAAERDSLLKNKKIKKPKKLPDISKGEQIGDLPKGWEFIRLNDLGEWGAGATPSRSNTELYGGEIPWFKSGELVGDYISVSEETVTEEALKKASLRFNKVGDVLLAMYGATIGKTSILEVAGTTNQAVCACTPFTGLSNVYLLTLLKAFKPRFIGMGAGGAQPNISREKIIFTVVALPPEPEQHRIVAKVDELMALCDQLEQQTENSIAHHQTLVEALLDVLTDALATRDENGAAVFQQAWQRIAENFDVLFTTEQSVEKVKQTILQLAVMGKLTDPRIDDTRIENLLDGIYTERCAYRNSSKEKDVLVEEFENSKSSIFNNRAQAKARFFCDFITKGTTPSKHELLVNGEIPFLKVYNIVNQQLDFDYKPTFIALDTHNKLGRSRIYPGDVIMNIVGPPLGKVAIVSNQFSEWNMNQALAVYRPVGGVFNKFIYFVLSARSTLESVLKEVKGTAGQDNLSLEQCRDLLITLPSIEEQHRIVTKVEELMTLCDQLKSQLTKSQATQLHLTDAIAEGILK